MMRGLFAAVIVTVFGATAQPAFASSIQFQLFGTISTTIGPFTSGEAYSLTAIFDSTTPDLNGFSTGGLFAGQSFSFTSPGYTATATAAFAGTRNEPSFDVFQIGATAGGGLTGAAISGQSPGFIVAVLTDNSGTALTSDALPIALTASGFATRDMRIAFCSSFDGNAFSGNCNSPTFVFGSVDRVAVGTPVPEPSTVALLGLGVVGAAAVRYRRRRLRVAAKTPRVFTPRERY